MSPQPSLGFGRSGSKSKTRTHKLDEEFRRIQGIATSILDEALGATLNQQEFQSALFSLLQPEFERIAKEGNIVDQLGSSEERQQFLRDTIDRNTKLAQQASELSDELSASVKNLGTLTDTDRELISSAIGGARKIGQEEIDAFVASNFRASNEVAAARGLRPSDAPIGNVRGRVAEEAVRQKGQLESQLATRAAGLALDIPLQRTALVGQLAGQQTGLAQGGAQFQAALAQNALANRLNLIGTGGQLGLGLSGQANIAPGTLAASRPAIGSKSSSFGFNVNSS